MTFSIDLTDDNIQDEIAKYGRIIVSLTSNNDKSSNKRNGLSNLFWMKESFDGNFVNIFEFYDLFFIKKLHLFDVGMQLEEVKVVDELNI